MTKRAVLYSRVSGDDRGRDGRNLAGQLEMCREYALQRRWHVVAELSEDDRGASGASFELPQLNQILEMAESGKFDVLVVRELDRLSRNLAKQLIVEEELKRNGVQVEYVLADYPDTPEGRLNKHIRATIAEFEREKITERMVRGRQNKVKAGSVLVYGRPPYGYRALEDNGTTKLVPHEREARVVRMIYTWYIQGDRESGPLSINAIVRKLDGTPTYADTYGLNKKREFGKWNASSVHRILKYETYAGLWHYGKRRRDTDGRWAQNPENSRLTVKVPSIVSREVWDAAQMRLTQNREDARRNRKYDYLVRRRVVCGGCGCKMCGVSRRGWSGVYLYYICPGTSHPDIARECHAPSFRADQVDAEVWDWVKSFLLDPEALASGLQGYQEEQKRQNLPMEERLAIVNSLLDDNRAQLERLLDLYLSGEYPKEVLTERKARLEGTVESLEREREGLLSRLDAHTLTESQIQDLQDFAARVGESLEVMGEFATRRRIIEELDVRVVVTVEDGKKVVYTQCVLDSGALHSVPLVV